MPDPLLDVPTILRALNQAGVKFVVIDGIAVAARGYERPTLNFDAVYAREPANYDARGKDRTGIAGLEAVVATLEKEGL